jgi:hypothetical protein
VVCASISGLGDGAGASCKRVLLTSKTLVQASNWEQFVEKMKAANLSEAAIAAFKQNYDQLVAGVTGLVGTAVHSWFAVLLQHSSEIMCCSCARPGFRES